MYQTNKPFIPSMKNSVFRHNIITLTLPCSLLALCRFYYPILAVNYYHLRAFVKEAILACLIHSFPENIWGCRGWSFSFFQSNAASTWGGEVDPASPPGRGKGCQALVPLLWQVLPACWFLRTFTTWKVWCVQWSAVLLFLHPPFFPALLLPTIFSSMVRPGLVGSLSCKTFLLPLFAVGGFIFKKSISYFSMPLRACYFGLLSVDLLLLIICSSAIRENLLKFHSHPLPLRQRNHLGLQQY